MRTSGAAAVTAKLRLVGILEGQADGLRSELREAQAELVELEKMPAKIRADWERTRLIHQRELDGIDASIARDVGEAEAKIAACEARIAGFEEQLVELAALARHTERAPT
jgi:hypothetical protein